MLCELREIILLLVCLTFNQLTNQYNEGLFPPPKYDFMNESVAKFCYSECLSKMKKNFECDECLQSNKTPNSVDTKTFCCFHYKQIECTYECLYENANTSSDKQTLTQDNDLSIQKIETIDDCSPYKSGRPKDCEFESTNPTETSDTESDSEDPLKSTSLPKEEDAWTFVLFVTCMGSVVIGITLFSALIYLTNVERQHFNAIRGNYTTVGTEHENQSLN